LLTGSKEAEAPLDGGEGGGSGDLGGQGPAPLGQGATPVDVGVGGLEGGLGGAGEGAAGAAGAAGGEAAGGSGGGKGGAAGAGPANSDDQPWLTQSGTQRESVSVAPGALGTGRRRCCARWICHGGWVMSTVDRMSHE
jgi:hypothetical protein